MTVTEPRQPLRNAGTVLAIIVASYLMIVVDISIVITGLPRIQASLGFSAAELSWVPAHAQWHSTGPLRSGASVFRSFTMNCAHLLASAAMAVAALGTAPAAFADSSTSSASSAGSASSGSVSDSIGGSSDASSPDKKKVAQGEYRVVDVAAAPDRPDTLRLTLQGAEPGTTREFVLFVPARALAARPMAAGDHVLTQVRPYGFEFAHADTRQAFFLALQDDWQQDLRTRIVQL